MGWGRAAIFAVGVVCAGPALAADEPKFGPPPTWVKPLEAPRIPDAKTDGGAAVHALLSDIQVSFAGDTTRTFVAGAVHAAKPEALAALGTVSLAWKPETDSLTVHWLRIRRAGKTLDILADQKFTVLRREQNLERAALDGILTATLSVPGLQVGDVLETAWTVERREPLLKGYHALMLDAGTGGNIARLGRSVQWDGDARVAIKTHNMPAPLARTSRGLSLSVDGVEPQILPQGAPLRFRAGRIIEVSDFPDWAAVSATFAPLYAAARGLEPNSPLNAEIARIKAASTDPAERASLALRLVQESIRYLFIGMADSNLRPASADETWRRRFGDCKAKTALLLALLDGLGIPAEAALVSTVLGDGTDLRLPNAAQFDHVIVRADVAGKTYWLDGTRMGDRSIGQLEVPAFFWALPLKLAGGALEPLKVAPKTAPNTIYALNLDATKGMMAPARARAEATFTGDAGLLMHVTLAAVAKGALEQQMHAFWSRQYDFITPEQVSQTWDETTRTQRLIMEGTARMAWNDAGGSYRRYQLDGVGVGWNPDFRRQPGPDSEAPFMVDYPDFAEFRETVLLPNDGAGFSLAGENVDRELAGIAIYRKTELSGNRVTMTTRQRPVKPEISYADAQAADAPLRALADGAVNILADSNRYQLTIDDAKTMLAKPADGSETDFRGRIAVHLEMGDVKSGLDMAQRYVSAFPKSAEALASRAMFEAASGMEAPAKADASAALAIAPNLGAAKGVLAYYAGPAGSTDDDRPRMSILGWRRWSIAEGCRRERDLVCARKNVEAALKTDPKVSDLYVLLANIHRQEGHAPEAAAIADRMAAVAPKDADIQAVAGVVYCSTGQCQKGLAAFARSIAIKPTITAYLNRARYLPPSDLPGRKRDIDAALQLAPDNVDALQSLAEWQKASGKREEEGATLRKVAALVVAGEPASEQRAFRLGAIYARAGESDKARANFAEYRGFAAAMKNGMALNNLCYTAATLNFDLDTALSDCQRAIALLPNDAAILDSLGFVQLRLGRLGDAIASYDKALELMPGIGPALFGRGIARLRQGDKAKAEADLAAATKLDANVADQFKQAGIAP